MYMSKTLRTMVEVAKANWNLGQFEAQLKHKPEDDWWIKNDDTGFFAPITNLIVVEDEQDGSTALVLIYDDMLGFYAEEE